MPEAGDQRNQGLIRNVFRKLRRHDSAPGPEQLRVEAESQAREAIALFINSDKQEEVAIYYANNQTTFDIRKQKKTTATILRYLSEEEGESGYDFFVVSHDSQGRAFFWSLYDTRGRTHFAHSKEFRAKDWDISLLKLREDQFLIEDAFKNIQGIHPAFYEMEPIEIDVMFGGLADKLKGPTDTQEENLGASQELIRQPVGV